MKWISRLNMLVRWRYIHSVSFVFETWTLFVPRRYCVPARMFLGLPERSHDLSSTFAWAFYDQKSSETVRYVERWSETFAKSRSPLQNWKKHCNNHISNIKFNLRLFKFYGILRNSKIDSRNVFFPHFRNNVFFIVIFSLMFLFCKTN